MIQLRPDQNDAAFPPFCYDEVCPESVVWLDDPDDDDVSRRETVRHRRPSLKVNAQVKRIRRPIAPRRLSKGSRELLKRVSCNSVMAQEFMASQSPAAPSVVAVENPMITYQPSASDVPDANSTCLMAKQQWAVRTESQPAVAVKLNRVRPKKVVASVEAVVECSAVNVVGSPEPAASLVPKSLFRRVTPRTDTRSERRRRKLERIRSEIKSGGPSIKLRPAEQTTGVADTPVPKQSPQRKRNCAATALQVSQPAAAARITRPRREKRRARQSVATPIDTSIPALMPLPAPTVASSGSDVVADVNDSDVAGAYRFVPPPAQVDEPYGDWFRRVVVRNRWVTWFTTFYLHWVILLLMAAVIVHNPELTSNLILNATIADQELPDLPPLEITPAVLEPEPVEAEDEIPVVEESVVAELAEMDIAISESLLDSMTEETPQSTNPSQERSERNNTNQIPETLAAPRPNPAPIEAVSAGSFSVWTEPAQPDPGEPYRIIIQIRLPEGVDRYDVADLQGLVVGSDGYRKPIPGSAAGELFINDSYARFVVPVVSADAEVRDTIFIKSRLLKETQKIVLEF